MSQRKRAALAVAVIVLFIAASIAVSHIAEQVDREHRVQRSAEGGSIPTSGALPPSDIGNVEPFINGESNAAGGYEAAIVNVFERAGGLDASYGRLPDRFEQELFSAEDIFAEHVACAQCAAGLVSPLGEEEVRSAIQGRMEQHGWRLSGKDSLSAASRGDSYEKDDGTYRWAFVICQNVAASTSVSVTLERKGSYESMSGM